MTRRVLITGASSGIGAELARTYARRGFELWLVGRDRDRLRGVAADVETAGGIAHEIVLDVADHDACARAVTRLDEISGGFDLVIANAGIGEARPAVSAGWECTRDVLLTNLVGAAATITPLIPRMAARGRGHVVGISSLCARIEAVGCADYGASKAGLSHYLESLRPELAAAGITVTVIEPGFIRTPMTDGNRRPMPFLLDLEPAAARIVSAIDRGAAVLRFPRRTVWAMRAARLIPRRLRDRLAVRMIRSRETTP